MMTATVVLALAGVTGPVTSPNPAWDDGWTERESWALTGHVQLTDEAEFLRAGESYFSPDGNMIIFQATPRPGPTEIADRHYGMYVAPVVWSGGTMTLGDAKLLSEPGSANTCGWFHPTAHTDRSYRVLFGSTTTPPDEAAASGYQRGTSRYIWQFPNEMEVVAGTVTLADRTKRTTFGASIDGNLMEETTTEVSDVIVLAGDFDPLWTRDGYDAEASWSPDGRHILYTRLAPGSDDGDLWMYDTKTKSHTPLVTEPGYDGGPFFSPDGKRICYRSDRRGDKALQLYIADLAFNDAGKVTGVAREIPVTDNGHVNWAPFFTPDGSILFYATSEVSHSNYEVYAIDAAGDGPPDERPRVRITDARGFDGLPVFTPDGAWMMWTAQRGAQVEGEYRPSSQVWAARLDLDAVRGRLDDARDDIRDRLLEERFDEFMPGGDPATTGG
jgi:hypothetical protein